MKGSDCSLLLQLCQIANRMARSLQKQKVMSITPQKTFVDEREFSSSCCQLKLLVLAKRDCKA